MDSIYHDCHGSRESATNPDAKVSFAVNIETTNSSSEEVEGVIILALQHAVVDAVAYSSCGSAVSSIFRPQVSVQGSCSQEDESCNIYQGSIIVRYHLSITDPTLQSLQAVVQHNEVIRSSRQAIKDSLDDIHQYINGVLLADDSTTTQVTNMSFSGDEETAIDVFDETSSSKTEGTGEIAVPPTPAPTRENIIVVAATQNESATKENDPNLFLLFGSMIGVLVLVLLFCCLARRRRLRNATNKAPVADDFEKSNHTEDEVSLHEQPEQQPRPSSVLSGSQSSAKSRLDDYRCHSITCDSCATCGYKAKKKFPWSSSSSPFRKSSLRTKEKKSKRHSSVELASDDGLFDQEDIAALQRMQQMDQKLFGGGQDPSSGVEFISAVGKSAVKMSVLHDLVLQETRRQQHGNRPEHEDDEQSVSEEEDSLV